MACGKLKGRSGRRRSQAWQARPHDLPVAPSPSPTRGWNRCHLVPAPFRTARADALRQHRWSARRPGKGGRTLAGTLTSAKVLQAEDTVPLVEQSTLKQTIPPLGLGKEL